jgi:hypothetical protein
MKWHLAVPFLCVSGDDRDFVFVTATAENPVSYKYVVTRGSKTFISYSDKLE